jgi:hypothetical protein
MCFGPVGKILIYDLAKLNNVKILDFGHIFKLYDMYCMNTLYNIDRSKIWKD